MDPQDVFKITADDYGYCRQRNIGIMESIERGIVNSISVLVNGSCVEPLSISFPKRVLMGLHLNLTEGDPVLEPQQIPTLLQSSKRFYPKLDMYQRLSERKVAANEVATEIEAQILKFKCVFKKFPDYIDGHQHIHVQPIVRDMLVQCMKRYQIVQTRIPSELGIEHCDWISKERQLFNKIVVSRSEEARHLFQENSITFPRYFIGLSVMSRDLTTEKLIRALDIVKEYHKKQSNCKGSSVTIEVMTHPGNPSEINNGGCSSDGPDEFACSEDRAYEKSFLTDGSIKNLFSKQLAWMNECVS